MEFIRLYTMRPREWLNPTYIRLGKVINQFERGDPINVSENAIVSEPFFLNASWLPPVKVMENVEQEQEQGLKIIGLESVEDLGGIPLSRGQKEVSRPVRAIFG